MLGFQVEVFWERADLRRDRGFVTYHTSLAPINPCPRSPITPFQDRDRLHAGACKESELADRRDERSVVIAGWPMGERATARVVTGQAASATPRLGRLIEVMDEFRCFIGNVVMRQK